MTTPEPLLGYSTNVHPGESLAAVYRFLRSYTLPIKERVFGSAPAGLELRLGMGAARDLKDPRAREEFRGFLDAAGLICFSINAYPLLDFHSRRVKETVYQPSWAQHARAHWTGEIARIFAALLPEGLDGSVSTLGGAFRGAGHGPAVFRKLATNYLKTVEALKKIEDERGQHIVLAVEPEPETTFETTRDVVDFVEEYLLPLAFERCRRHGRKGAIEEIVRRYFAVNVDTCHLSVLYEDQVQSQRLLERAGVRLGKLHITSAVSLRNPFRSPRAYQDLRAMDEPRYFHQFCGRDAGGKVLWRGLDLDRLPRTLDAGRDPAVSELRSHFHVPLYLKRYHRLHTTREETEHAVHETLRRKTCRHLVLETYTWPILAGRSGTRQKLINGITREYRWLLDVIHRARSGRR